MRISAFRQIIFAVTTFGILSSIPAFAEERNPCKSDGSLKRWAVIQGYSPDACTGGGSTSEPDSGTSEPTTSEDLAQSICKPNGTLKRWARRLGYSDDVCQAEPQDSTSDPVASDTPDEPATETPPEDSAPTEDTVASDTPAEEPPVEEAPAEEPPPEDSIANDTTAEEPVEEPAPPPNTPPTISIVSPGNGLSVEEGTEIQFVANANDSEDGNLNDQVNWHSSRDGLLFADQALSVGIHEITASVTDSSGDSESVSVTMEVVEIVEPVTHASVQLDWAPPLAREDGSPLSMDEIGGVEIVVVNGQTNTSDSITLAGGSITSHTVELERGHTYYFAVSTYDNAGRFSAATDPVSLNLD